MAADGLCMKPLRVRAHLRGRVFLPGGPPALDSILAYQVARRSGLPEPHTGWQPEPVEIPVQREPGGRFHMCSFGVVEKIGQHFGYTNRRPPITEMVHWGVPKLTRVDVSKAEDKAYHMPRPETIARWITWWCIGDREATADLLRDVTHVGKKRAPGLGALREDPVTMLPQWEITEMEEVWDGFPVLAADGEPMRPLPLDYPGLGRHGEALRVLTYPYWIHTTKQPLAVPTWF